MRSSRLVALLFELQEGGPTTAPKLAKKLEVSVRTIYRDVAALQAAGVPLWTETGPQGGIRLLEGWRTRLDGMTADEAGVLALAGAPAAVADLGLGSVLAAAQAKVRSTLPPELRSRADRMAERFHLDAPGWFHHDEELTHLAAIADAVWEGQVLRIGYRRGSGAADGRDGPVTSRVVGPLGLVQKAGTWYLVARVEQDVRTYRVSRIATVEALDERVQRPEGFHLATWWADSSTQFDRAMLRNTARLRLSPAGARALPRVLDQQAAQEALQAADAADEEGWVTVDVRVESAEIAGHQLLALGGHVEALAPPELRAHLAAEGRAMAERNGGATPSA
ncbi:transcriptional regulator [cyanobacterium TDX16]|nr:transcriptional regulator [cyanobacterium TDX16]